MRRLLLPAAAVLIAAAAAFAVAAALPRGGGRAMRAPAGPTGIHKIRHVIVIMQENRSFDSYFGTYPGADGIPMLRGEPAVCVPDPAEGTCVRPYHDPGTGTAAARTTTPTPSATSTTA